LNRSKYSIRSLESSERRYHSLFSSSLDAIILWNGNEIVHANPAAYRLFGWEQTNSKINAPSHEMIRYCYPNRDTMHEWSDTVSIPKTGKRTLNIRIVSITLDAIPMDLIQIRDITEETRLHEEIHRLADIVRNTQSGIIAGPIHAPHIVNDAYTRLHGFTYDEAVEMGFFGPIHPDYQQDVPVWIRTAKESGHVTGQAPRIRKNGTEFPALHDLTIMKDSDNEPYLILNVQDISEHIRVWRLMLEKEALSDSLSLLSSILDNLPDPTFVIDTHGSVLAWNKAMNILSPIPREEIIAGNVSYAEAIYHKNRPMLIDKVIQPDLDITPYYYGNMKAENGIYSAEVCYQEQNGGVGYRWVLAGPLFDSKGEMIGAIETVRDITELKEAITSNQNLRIS
jgi:PAS domain S-box-containing protein